MREDIKAALRYPMIVVVALVAAMFIVNIFVVPAFGKIFASFKSELPLMTRILIGTSDFFVRYWPLLIVAPGRRGGRLSRLVGTPGGRYLWDRLKLRLPVVGELIHKATLARFSRSFALSGKSGVPIVQALAVVASVVDNAFLRRASCRCATASSAARASCAPRWQPGCSARWCCRWWRWARKPARSTP